MPVSEREISQARQSVDYQRLQRKGRGSRKGAEAQRERTYRNLLDGEDKFPIMDTESSTTWKEIGENWFPVEAYFAQISGFPVDGEKPLAESWTIKMNYAIGDDVKGPVIADFPSVELREYLIQKAR